MMQTTLKGFLKLSDSSSSDSDKPYSDSEDKPNKKKEELWTGVKSRSQLDVSRVVTSDVETDVIKLMKEQHYTDIAAESDKVYLFDTQAYG